MYVQKPEWLRIKIGSNDNSRRVEEILKQFSLNTVCEEANCPNRTECFGKSTATFMILGKACTRNCTFCNVEKRSPEPVDPQEPVHVAQAVGRLNLRHVVITSVTRDDLPDGGAGHFSDVISEIKKLDRRTVVEVLIPDFQGNTDALSKVVKAGPDIINHNIETVPRLYPYVRPMAVYQSSLRLLENVKLTNEKIFTKSGIMLGLGERKDEVTEVFEALRRVRCDFLTIGQYLAPSKKHHPVVEYIHPDIFDAYKEQGLAMGFKHVASGPLVRSSYQAAETIDSISKG